MSFAHIVRSVAGRLSLRAPQGRSLEILDRITEIAPPGKRATVLAKKEAAIKWCKNASDYAAANGGKPWRYVLIPHTAIAVNMMRDGLAGQFGCYQDLCSLMTPSV